MLEKKYDFKSVENGRYDAWKEKGYFEFEIGVVNVTPFGSNLGNPKIVERLKCYFIQLFRQRKEVM